jgi:predicted phosphoserine aminotransferase
MALKDREPGRFFLPGPTEVHPDVLAAQARPVIGHRGKELPVLMESLQEGLRDVFRTKGPVLVAASSATGLMEAAIRNGVRRSVLCLVNGAFSARFAEIARACGREVEVAEVPWGEAHDPAQVAERLAAGAYDAVTVVHSETSTGALNPIDALARVVRAAGDVHLLVDSVSGLGGAPVLTDDWALDLVLTGAQKAMALPPGLAFAATSERLMERAAALPDRGFYFDLVRFHDEMTRFQTPTTPAVTLLYALEAQLARMRSEGLEARWERHAAMARRCWAWVEELRQRGVDVGILAPEGARSPTVTCVTLPEGVRGPDVVGAVRERGWVIGGGYGKLKERAVRIGHMGEHDLPALEELLAVLEEVLQAVPVP